VEPGNGRWPGGSQRRAVVPSNLNTRLSGAEDLGDRELGGADRGIHLV
jgi:hypothetical protein